jgi:3-oxoacyl-[acyl-carrier-protein] synthase II
MIVVSGIGIVSPLGASREVTWRRLLDGETGIRVSPRGLEARVYDFSPNGARSRMGDFALLAAREALRQAGLDAATTARLRIGCAVSQSKPVMEPFDGALVMSQFFGWSPAQVLMRDLHLNGPSTNVVAACATGVASIVAGEQWLREGLCDAVLVGAAESSLNDFYRAGFAQMGVLADDARGASAVRPFDRDRSGFAMGEGAAVLVLEKADVAHARGVVPLASLGRAVLRQSSGDALRFDEDGSAVAALIQRTCENAAAPDYINAHGTGTVFNDAIESRGIRQALGARAAQTPVSSTKAATGHLLGAAGAVEAALSVLALRDQMIPPTLNLDHTDCDAELDYVPHRSRRASLASVLSLSYGFGGQMGAVAFNAWR